MDRKELWAEMEAVKAENRNTQETVAVTRQWKMEARNLWKMEAENCYARAVVHQRNGEYDEAKRYGRRAVDLYKKVDVRTLDDAAPTRMSIIGVSIADIMHEDVVRQRLGLEDI